jgi:V8-like Glu-specific endopeptidase
MVKTFSLRAVCTGELLAFCGVVSITINCSNQSYICSGTLVNDDQVVSAGHCVDTAAAASQAAAARLQPY